MNKSSFHKLVKIKAAKLILYTSHAVKQMNSEKRMITTNEVQDIVDNGAIIEYYPEDKRGASCLIAGKVKNRYIHVVCTPKDDYLAIITAYIPDPEKWDETFKKRKSK